MGIDLTLVVSGTSRDVIQRISDAHIGVATGQLLVSGIAAVGVIVSLAFVTRSNRRLAAVQNLTNLQQVMAEMNKLRMYRADNPDLERRLFPNRNLWTDLEIQQNLIAVQFANIFEWAFIAHGKGLLDEDVWSSWLQTWSDVILASDGIRTSLVDTVWTFGREAATRRQLRRLLNL